MFNHPSVVDTYTAFKNKIDVDMGSYETNFDLIFNHVCLFQNTEQEKMIVYGSEMNGTFYGWQSVVK